MVCYHVFQGFQGHPSTNAREVVGSKFELPASYDWTRLDEYALGCHGVVIRCFGQKHSPFKGGMSNMIDLSFL